MNRHCIATPASARANGSLQKPDGAAMLASWSGAPLERCVFFGDRVLTDVIFARTHGMCAVHVMPFTDQGDPWIVRAVSGRWAGDVCPLTCLL